MCKAQPIGDRRSKSVLMNYYEHLFTEKTWNDLDRAAFSHLKCTMVFTTQFQ